MLGREWAYLGAIIGGFVSIAANVAHSFLPPTGAGPEWSPEAGAVAMSIFWPVALFVTVEILARVAWPSGGWWQVLRFGGVSPVAAVAAVVSYRHLSGLLDAYGEDKLTTVLGPLAVDGLMIIATGAILATGRRAAKAAPAPHPAALESTPAAVPVWPVAVPAGARTLPIARREVVEVAPTGSPADAVEIPPAPPGGRPAAETRRLVALLREADPKLTQQQLADRLGIKRRTLRDALAEPTVQRPARLVAVTG